MCGTSLNNKKQSSTYLLHKTDLNSTGQSSNHLVSWKHRNELAKVVILNKDDYISKTEEILNDKTKFMIIKGDWFRYVVALEDRLNRILRKIKTKLPENTYNNLFSWGSTHGILYGFQRSTRRAIPWDQFSQPLIFLTIIWLSFLFLFCLI